MGDGDGRLWHCLAHPLGHLFNANHTVVDEIDLSASIQFTQDGSTNEGFVIIREGGLDGQSFLRRRVNRAHVAHARQGHVQRAGDGCGCERQHIYLGAHLLQPLLVAYTKSLLLINHE